MKLKRKMLAWLMILTMLIGVLPANSMVAKAEEDTIIVYVTMINKGNIENDKNGNALMNVPMEIPSGTVAIDAVKKVHEVFHQDGAYAYAEASGFFSTFWGEVTYSAGYFRNGISVNAPTTEVMQEGDYLDLMLYDKYQTDLYADFTTRSYSVEGGETVNLTLKVGDVFNNSKNCDGTSILYSKDGTVPSLDTGSVTDADGKVGVTFYEAGTYYLMASKSGSLVNSSIAKVEVTSTLDTAKIVSDAKEA